MKILCYGDSNTFGFNPENASRYDQNSRFSGILKNELKPIEVIECGLNNRVGFVDSINGVEYSAKNHLLNFLKKQDGIDVLILAIGINDLQFQYEIEFETIKKELNNLIKIAKQTCGQIILVSPCEIGENILNSYFKTTFNSESILKSKELSKIYSKIAQENNCKFLDLNKIVEPSKIDGLHFDIYSHKIIAKELIELCRLMF